MVKHYDLLSFGLVGVGVWLVCASFAPQIGRASLAVFVAAAVFAALAIKADNSV